MTRAITVLIILNLLAVIAAMIWGDQSIAWRDVANALVGSAPADLHMIVIEFRLSRAMLALLAGTGLAVAGTISQTVMRNPLAEPGVLGINAGAALVASVVIILLQMFRQPSCLGRALRGPSQWRRPSTRSPGNVARPLFGSSSSV